jgi:hypothetical protein
LELSLTEKKAKSEAVLINRDIDVCFLRFQIMGLILKLVDATIQEFVNKMMDSEQSQLQLFVNYIINSLDDELQNLDFKVL